MEVAAAGPGVCLALGWGGNINWAGSSEHRPLCMDLAGLVFGSVLGRENECHNSTAEALMVRHSSRPTAALLLRIALACVMAGAYGR